MRQEEPRAPQGSSPPAPRAPGRWSRGWRDGPGGQGGPRRPRRARRRRRPGRLGRRLPPQTGGPLLRNPGGQRGARRLVAGLLRQPHALFARALLGPAWYAVPGLPERYPARDEVVGYLRGYAEAFGLPVLAGKRVLRAERDAGRDADAGFRLLT